MKKVLAILAKGSEEIELVTAVDVLRRAGITVTLAGLKDASATVCSRNVVLVPDTSLDQVSSETFDAIVLPGGLGGTNEMSDSAVLGELLKRQESSNRIIAAICAAPLALLAHSIGLGKSITSYPGVKDKLTASYKYIDDQLVVVHEDNLLITSRGPATSMIFALKLTELLVGQDKAQEVSKGLLLNSDYKL